MRLSMLEVGLVVCMALVVLVAIVRAQVVLASPVRLLLLLRMAQQAVAAVEHAQLDHWPVEQVRRASRGVAGCTQRRSVKRG